MSTTYDAPAETIVLRSLADTAAVGARLARSLRGGDCVLLHGDLGSGKTAFVKATAEALGLAPAEVHSPTFSLLNVHERGDGWTLCHADLYRLEADDELDAIGLLDWIGDRDAVVFVEWPARILRWLHDVPTWQVELRLERDARWLSLRGPRPLEATTVGAAASARAGDVAPERRDE